MKNKYLILSFSFVFLVLGVLYFILPSKTCLGDYCLANVLSIENKNLFKDIRPNELMHEIQNNQAFLLDVRTLEEWQSDGVIKGASLIPLDEINENSVSVLPKDIPIYVYCRSGNRSQDATILLRSLGFNNTFDIGGINQYVKNGGYILK